MQTTQGSKLPPLSQKLPYFRASKEMPHQRSRCPHIKPVIYLQTQPPTPEQRELAALETSG